MIFLILINVPKEFRYTYLWNKIVTHHMRNYESNRRSSSIHKKKGNAIFSEDYSDMIASLLTET